MTEHLDAFRAETRAWLEENCPPSMRLPATEDDDVWGGRRGVFKHPDQKLWMDRAVARGYTVPTWEPRYGGAGLCAEEARVLDEEMTRLGCRMPLKNLGTWLLAPALLEFATEEQKLEHLPKMARGEIRWCQGYSEPNAGSDLAGVQTSAVLDPEGGGDQYIVSGQKVWTSHADKADWMFCLVRTDASAPRHDGISFLLIDMATPGVSVRPIRLISGHSHFCETFFDGVRVPRKNLVGKPGAGWSIAKRVLQHERSVISRVRDRNAEEDVPLEVMARRYLGAPNDQTGGMIGDASLRQRIIQANLDALCNKLTLRRSAEATSAGLGPGPETSIFKYYGTELSKRRKELRVMIAGFSGLGWEDESFSPFELAVTKDWLRSRASSIEGGTSEIQLNIIAKRVLGLPD